MGDFENAFEADACNELVKLPEGVKALLPVKNRYTKRPDMGVVTKKLGIDIKAEKPSKCFSVQTSSYLNLDLFYEYLAIFL